jgi:hypothetical protein
VDSVDPPSNQDMIPRWILHTLKDVEGHTTPRYTHRDRRDMALFGSYVPLMRNIIDSEPSSFEETTSERVWKDSMM